MKDMLATRDTFVLETVPAVISNLQSLNQSVAIASLRSNVSVLESKPRVHLIVGSTASNAIPSTLTIVGVPLTNVVRDTHAKWNPTTSQYTVPVDGYYLLSGSIRIQASSSPPASTYVFHLFILSLSLSDCIGLTTYI